MGKGLRLVLHLDSSNPEAFEGGYALVDLTPELAETCLKRVEAFRRLAQTDSSARSIYFWDCSPEHFEHCDELGSTEDVEGCVLSEALEGADYAVLDGGKDEDTPVGKAKKFARKAKGRHLEIPEKDRMRTECDQICVDEGGCTWMCYPKHCSGVELTTREIPVAVLEDVAGRKITVRSSVAERVKA